MVSEWDGTVCLMVEADSAGQTMRTFRFSNSEWNHITGVFPITGADGQYTGTQADYYSIMMDFSHYSTLSPVDTDLHNNYQDALNCTIIFSTNYHFECVGW